MFRIPKPIIHAAIVAALAALTASHCLQSVSVNAERTVSNRSPLVLQAPRPIPDFLRYGKRAVARAAPINLPSPAAPSLLAGDCAVERYEVIAFGVDGRQSVFSRQAGSR